MQGMIDDKDLVVRAVGLRKSFTVKRRTSEAVRGVDLSVARGEIFGFLGPNGAGKTTTLRILTTLLPADVGEAFVAGADVRRCPRDVRRRIGYVGQLGGADIEATGRENLLLQARLYGLSASEATRRADELMTLLDLGTFADRIAKTYSGGQRRRLEVALGIIHRPEVLFLDEPTTGLDPQNRANLWEQLRLMRAEGTAIFLTTHYLDEADQLSDRVAIIDHGQIVSEGTPQELKQRLPAGCVRLHPDIEPADLAPLERALAAEAHVEWARVDGDSIQLQLAIPAELETILARLNARGIELKAISMNQPSLDDVFLSATGRSLRDAGDPVQEVAA